MAPVSGGQIPVRSLMGVPSAVWISAYLTITTPVAQTAVRALQDPAIPVVFAAVQDPIVAGVTPNWRQGGPNMTGPNLYGVFGQQAGAHPGFNYSTAMQEADFVWDGEQLDNWLENPRTFLKGTKMSFAGIPDETDRRDVIAFLKVETGYAQP